MSRKLLPRGLIILASIVVAVVLAYPPKDKISLGLDLRGGMHLVLQVHTQDAVRAEVESDMDRLLRQAQDAGIAGLTGRRANDTSFEVLGTTEANRDTVSGLVTKYLPDYTPAKGAAGLVFAMKPAAVAANEKLAVTQ